ncbi:MAG: DUF3419 family protein [Lautropia sp.]|nr:DUF3419 family protein [Lautropia sp.]
MHQKWILYSTCDEDADSEMKALSISPVDDVLSVTGSGCRSLSLLSMNPASLSTIDYAAGQNLIFELKLAAIRSLSYRDLLNFLGIRNEGMDRKDTFLSLKDRLSDEAWMYFKNNMKKIENGIIFQGRHEQFYVKIMAPLFKTLYGRSIERIFNSETLDEQREIF